MSLPVCFTYFTGLTGTSFNKAFLVGSWDAAGQYSDQWSEQEMPLLQSSPDNTQAYRATVKFADQQEGWTFHWGVTLEDAPGDRHWAIFEEVNDAGSRDRHLSFQLARAPLGGNAQEVSYYLCHGRRLGAQKFGRGIRFAVWAPNASNVEVLMAALSSNPNGPSYIDPAKTPANPPAPRERIFGGYVGDDGDGVQPGWGPFPMRRDSEGIWSTDPVSADLGDFNKFDHAPYMFRVTKDDSSIAYRTDIYSRCQIGWGSAHPKGSQSWDGRTVDLDGTVSCSVVVDPDQVTEELNPVETVWPETNWISAEEFWSTEVNDPPRAQRIEDLIIYELHVGALGFGKAANDPGTIADAVALLDYLVDLGVNAVELLPMAEFGGGAGWGYATSHYFAIEYAGGGRDQYKWFIRECHRRGIAVIVDVVYNHYNHSADRAEWLYDSNDDTRNSYYWYEGHPGDYAQFAAAVPGAQRGQGGYVDNMSTGWAPRYNEPMVRRMFLSSALTQATEFHIDGFRMDQTTSIHAYNVLHADGRPLEKVNQYGAKLLREITRALKAVKPRIMLSAEDHSNWEGVTQPPDEGGLGFDAAWFADFYHHLIGDTDKGDDYAKLLKNAGRGDDRPLAMDTFAGVLAATGGRKIVYNASHDEAGNGKFTQRTIRVAVNDAPLFGDTRRVAEARCRFAAGMAILSAGTPMFLFGEEVGAEKDFLYGKVLENREDLRGMRNTTGAKLFAFYSALIRFRLKHAAIRSRNIEVVYTHNQNRILAFRRWSDDGEFLILGSLNNHPFNNPSCMVHSGRIAPARWREVFNSDAEIFGGNNVGNAGGECICEAGRFSCALPSNGFVVFERMN